MHALRLRVAPLIVVALLTAADARAQVNELLDLSLEQLLNIRVTSVDRSEHPLATTPAAVHVITRDDIRRSGASTLPDLLRLVPGVQVARYSNSKWSVSARGFGSYYANKLLVQVDGRSVFTPDFSGVFWDLVPVPLEDIDRIEVVRGPGGTMWGANAMNGVINIITKPAAQTTGTRASLATGSEERATASFRFGDTAGVSAYRIYARTTARDLSGSADEDSSRTTSAGFRWDHESGAAQWTLQGDVFDASQRAPISVPQLTAPFSRAFSSDVAARGGYVLGRHVRPVDGGELTVQAYYDYNERREYIHDALSHTVDLDVQHHRQVGARHEVLWGGGYRYRWSDITETWVMRYQPARSQMQLASAFLQDEIHIRPSFVLTVGAKLEHHRGIRAALQPSARAAWMPTATQTAWFAVARGIRTPSLAERFATFRYRVLPPSPLTGGLPLAVDVVGDPSQQVLEDVVSFEAGYRIHPHPALAFDLAAFHNVYDHLASYARGAPALATTDGVRHLVMPSLAKTQAAGEAHGFEGVARWVPRTWWTVSGSLTLLDLDLRITDPAVVPGDSLPVLLMSPRVQFGATSSFTMGRRLELDLTHARSGAWQSGNRPASSRTDVRLGWRLHDQATLEGGVQSLLEPNHIETAPYMSAAPGTIPRSVFVRFIWGF